MHKEEQSSPIPFTEHINRTMNLVLLVCEVLSLPIMVILHRRIGSRRIGLSALGTLLVIPLWATWFPNDDPIPMLWLLGIFIFACIGNNLCAWGRCWLGDTVHRHSDGIAFPRYWLWFLPSTLASYIEVALVFLSGLILLPLYQGLGSYMAVAAVARLILILAQRMFLSERVAVLRDQQLEQQIVIEQFRRIGRG